MDRALGSDSKWGVLFQSPLHVRESWIGFYYYGRAGELGDVTEVVLKPQLALHQFCLLRFGPCQRLLYDWRSGL